MSGSGADEYRAFSCLRHSEIRCVYHSVLDKVAHFSDSIDDFLFEPSGRCREQCLDVLNDENLRLQLIHDVEIFSEQEVAGIGKPEFFCL